MSRPTDGRGSLGFPLIGTISTPETGNGTALSSGDLNRNGFRQVHQPKPIILASNSGTGEATQAVPCLVPIPSVRTRVKVTVAFVATAGSANPNLIGVGKIWIAAADYEPQGVGGGGGRVLPITDLEGTQAAPTAFPASADLVGYSRAFSTIADVLVVVPTLSSLAGTAGAWLLITKLEVTDAPFTSVEEWDAVRRLFLPQLTGSQAFL